MSFQGFTVSLMKAFNAFHSIKWIFSLRLSMFVECRNTRLLRETFDLLEYGFLLTAWTAEWGKYHPIFGIPGKEEQSSFITVRDVRSISNDSEMIKLSAVTELFELKEPRSININMRKGKQVDRFWLNGFLWSLCHCMTTYYILLLYIMYYNNCFLLHLHMEH